MLGCRRLLLTIGFGNSESQFLRFDSEAKLYSLDKLVSDRIGFIDHYGLCPEICDSFELTTFENPKRISQ